MAGKPRSERKNMRERKTRRWPFVLAGILLVVVLAVLLTPVYLSSDGFKRLIQTKIDRSTGGTAAIGNLTVGWLRGIRISDFSFQDKVGWASVSIGGIDTQPRLGALLGGALALGETTIDRPRIELDMRKRPAPAVRPAGGNHHPSGKAAGLVLLGNLAINDGSVHLTDRKGKTVQFTNLDSQVSLRRPGQPSRVEVDMVVADAGNEAQIHAAGTVTPAKGSGWTLKGTSGDVVIEVNDLNLDSLAAVFELAGVELQAQGQVSADIKGTLNDGRMETVTAEVTGQNLDVTGAALNGDRIQTSHLGITAKLTQDGQAVRIDQLQARTDWASLIATGTVPTSAKSLADLLKTDSAYDLQGTFDCKLPALLSQMPHTFGLKEGMQITAGRATGTVNSTTQAGRATIAVQTEVVGLAGTLDGKELVLSEPLVADLRLSADEKNTKLEALNVSAAFAKVNASGDFEQIAYEARVDLTTLQSELGSFINLGPYQMAGTVVSKGQVAVQDSNVVATGSADVNQLVLASADGNSVSEPQANIDFAVNLDREKQSLTIDRIDLKGGFGNLSARAGTVPLGETSPVPMKVDVIAQDLDLAKMKPYAILFASFPKDMDLAGMAQSQIAITAQEKKYRIQTADTQIQDFKLLAPEKEPFERKQVTLLLDAVVDPNTRGIKLEAFELDGQDIKIKGRFEKSQQGDSARVEGTLEGQCDWAAVGQIASEFLPEGLELTGQRPFAMNFASTYPADDPNGLMANLDAATSTGFDTALYKGLNMGPTNVDIRIEKGLMTITPFTTTVNNGQFNFAGKADFKEKSRFLRTPEPMVLAKGIELNKEMTAQLLKYVNPLFANVTGISGLANFDCETLAIPLAAGMEKEAEVVGTISADNVLLEASGLLDQIIKASGGNLRGQRLTIRPTRITLQNGKLQYDNMQIDVGDNPVTFGGTITLDGELDMVVTLPWTLRGRTARVGREGRAGPRIEVPLRGTINQPELDLGQLLQNQILRGLESLF